MADVLTLDSTSARKFFLSQEAYSNMELPPYFVFNKVLLDIKKFFSGELLKDGRVNFIAPADYSRGKSLDIQIKKVIDKMTADYNLED